MVDHSLNVVWLEYFMEQRAPKFNRRLSHF